MTLKKSTLKVSQNYCKNWQTWRSNVKFGNVKCNCREKLLFDVSATLLFISSWSWQIWFHKIVSKLLKSRTFSSEMLIFVKCIFSSIYCRFYFRIVIEKQLYFPPICCKQTPPFCERCESRWPAMALSVTECGGGTSAVNWDRGQYIGQAWYTKLLFVNQYTYSPFFDWNIVW